MDSTLNVLMIVGVAGMGLIFITVLLATIFFVCVNCAVIYDKAFPFKKKEWINHRQPGEWEQDLENLASDLEEMANKWK